MKRLTKRHTLCLITFLAGAFLPLKGDENSQWEYSITPYAWLGSLEGDVDTFPLLPPAEVDLDFWDDILGNINMAFMLTGEARKDRFGVAFDVVYFDIEQSASMREVVFDSLDLRVKLWVVSSGVTFRIVETEDGFADFVAGIRYMSVDSRLTLRSEGPTVRRDGSDDWFDPLLGFKGTHWLGDSPWFINGAFMIGGLGVGSDFFWDANLNAGYQWSETFATTLGYRYMDVDYDEDDFLFDVAAAGLVIGFNWQW